MKHPLSLKTNRRHATLALIAASLAFLPIPWLIEAGPTPGEYTGKFVRICPVYSPKTLPFKNAKVQVTNTTDPGADFGNKVVASGKSGRANVRLETAFTGSDRLQVTLRGRDSARSPGAPGGRASRRYTLRGTGPAVVTANSFGTKSGVGKVGRLRARFTYNVASSGDSVRIRFDVRASKRSPFGSRLKLSF